MIRHPLYNCWRAACCAPTLPSCPPFWLLLVLLRRREPDHLHPRAVRDVHGLHHVEVLAVRRRLDEQQLRRTRIVDLVERLVELAHRVRLAVDGIRSVAL